MDSRRGQTRKEAGGREEGIRRGSVVIWRGLSNKVYGDSLSQGWGSGIETQVRFKSSNVHPAEATRKGRQRYCEVEEG